MEEVIEIKPDKERAQSLINLAKLRYDKTKSFNVHTDTALILEGYYEAIKELLTAMLYIKGLKIIGHKQLIEYSESNLKLNLLTPEFKLMHQLRKYRNKIVYDGVHINPSFLKRNSHDIHKIINSLFNTCKLRLQK